MANSIGWGQGASNNQIGWGQGAVNNNIYWGRSHILTTYVGETDIIGKNYNLAVTFQSRVNTDLGTFEALDCLISTLNKI